MLASDGFASRAIGREAGGTTGTASKWRVRYAARRLAGLDETGNRGNEPKYTTDTARRILRVLDLRSPDGHGRWTGALIAKALGDVDVQQVWRVLRAQKIDLAARKSWCWGCSGQVRRLHGEAFHEQRQKRDALCVAE